MSKKSKRKIIGKMKLDVVRTKDVQNTHPELAALMKADELWFDAHPDRNERIRECLGSVEFFEDLNYSFANLIQDLGPITHILITKKGKMLQKIPMSQRMTEIFLEEYEKAKGYPYEEE